MSLKKLVKENRSYLPKQKSYLSRGLFYRQFHLEKAVKNYKKTLAQMANRTPPMDSEIETALPTGSSL